MRTFTALLLICLFSSCANYGQLEFIAKLPKKLTENSGIAVAGDSLVWFIEDNGNPDELYLVDYNGNIRAEIEIDNAKNDDWEDLTVDYQGHVYIADIGNNDNDRDDLMIYKVPVPSPNDEKIKAEVIAFEYPEQEKFPPKRDKLFYDAEALFYYQDSLYIFTKNRARPFTGKSLLYQIPAEKGEHEARLLGDFTPCEEYGTCQVTSAEISPDGTTLAILGYGKLWLVTDFDLNNFSKKTVVQVDLGVRTQLEAVCFLNDNVLLLSDEATGPTGRNLYSYTIKSP